jgi:hypothetical protein
MEGAVHRANNPRPGPFGAMTSRTYRQARASRSHSHASECTPYSPSSP